MQRANRFNQPAEYKGFKLPKAALELLYAAFGDHWLTGWQWQESNSGAPFVTVHVAHRETREYFQYTWSSYETSTLRLRGKLHQPAGKGVWVDGPSLKAVISRVREDEPQNS